MEFILSLIILLLLFIVPTIICVAPGLILAAIIISLIRKMLKKDEKFKSFIYAIVIFFCVLVSMKLGYSFISYESAKPDEQYIEMNEINDNQSLIGLSKEQVVELLGEPQKNSRDDLYTYDAGTLTNYLFFGERESYDLFIRFDENYIVKSTEIHLPLGG